MAEKQFEFKNSHLIWFLGSIGVLILIAYMTDVSEIIESLKTVNLILLIPAILSSLLIFGVWGFVYYNCFRETGVELDFEQSIKAFLTGNFFNSITPIGQFGGAPILAYIITRNTGEEYEKTVSSIFSANLINAIPGASFVVAGAILLSTLGLLNNFLAQMVYFTVAFALFFIFIGYLLWFRSGTVEDRISWFFYKASKIIGRGENFAKNAEKRLNNLKNSFGAIGEDPKFIIRNVFFSHLAFIFKMLTLYFILLSFGVTPDYHAIFFIISFATVSVFAPTPGGLGAFESFFALFAFIFLPVSFATGFSMAIMYRLVTYWLGVALGYYSFYVFEN